MIIKCINSFRHQIIEGNNYLVIEIIIKKINNLIYYRIIDEEGYPAIYDADSFVIISNSIKNFAILFEQNRIVLSHNLILNSKVNNENIDGFWGAFIDNDIKTKQILKQVVCDLAIVDNIIPPKLNME